jgi:uncharacterized protein involved in exopolysaccharide biosynthesis
VGQIKLPNAQAEVIEMQEQEIAALKRQLQVQNATLEQRLSRLEKLVGNEPQTLAQK